MLEQAEVIISGVNNLIDLPEISKDTRETAQLKKILSLYRDYFSPDDLPKDLVRLCKNTNELLLALDLKVSDIKSILNTETASGRGNNYKNLSPFLLVLQSIINQRTSLVQGYIDASPPKKFKLVLPKELQTGSLLVGKSGNVVTV